MTIDYYISFGFKFHNTSQGVDAVKKSCKLIFKSINEKSGNDMDAEVEEIFGKIDDIKELEDIISYIMEQYKYEVYPDLQKRGDFWLYNNSSQIKLSLFGVPHISLGNLWAPRREAGFSPVSLEVINKCLEWVNELKRNGRLDKDVELGIITYCSF